jgi:hypothetical protein
MRTSCCLRPFASLGVTAILFLIGCASATPDSRKAPLDEPEVVISQISNIAEVARNITGAISVQYQVAIANHSKDPITVKRIDVMSIGLGAYLLRPSSVPAEVRLNPGESKAMQFWASASIDDPTILGANGPVTLRVTVTYDTPAGSSQRIVVQQVHAMPGS